MIDIHAHVLPQVDDGPSSWEEALLLLQRGEEDGVRGVVCTSHVLDQLDKEIESVFIHKFEELQKRAVAAGLKMNLWLGAEIHINALLDLESPVATLNGNGKYVLIELPLSDMPHDVLKRFEHLTNQGIIPILAHPERNSVILKKLQYVYDFIQKGVLIQLNAGSILGKFGKKVKHAAIEMLSQQWVHFVASDSHSPTNRTMSLSPAYHAVENQFGQEVAERLFRVQPYKAVIGEEISPPPPLILGEKGSPGPFQKFRLFKGR